MNVKGELRKHVDVTLLYNGRWQQSFVRTEETDQISQSFLANHRALNGSGASQIRRCIVTFCSARLTSTV